VKIFITGAAGFIGSNLSSTLLRSGHTVIGLDDFSYGEKRNIAGFEADPNFTFHEGNVLDIQQYLQDDIDTVVHLASQKIPRYTNAYKTIVDNNLMTDKVIEACLSINARLVFASTSDVYGKNPHVPFTENSDLVLGPTTVKRWAYAASKLFSEHKIIATSDEKGLEYCIMRFFGSYGPNQNLTWWGGPQSVFIGKANQDETIEIHGHGQQTRTFTYIDDTVQGIVLCITSPNAKNEIYNIASNPTEEITIEDLGKVIWHLVRGEHSDPKLQFIPYETFGNYEDVMRRVPSIEKIKTQLGFDPKHSLIEGLKATIAWQLTLAES
jgi:UDP-glucose 4-epimerase